MFNAQTGSAMESGVFLENLKVFKSNTPVIRKHLISLIGHAKNCEISSQKGFSIRVSMIGDIYLCTIIVENAEITEFTLGKEYLVVDIISPYCNDSQVQSAYHFLNTALYDLLTGQFFLDISNTPKSTIQ